MLKFNDVSWGMSGSYDKCRNCLSAWGMVDSAGNRQSCHDPGNCNRERNSFYGCSTSVNSSFLGQPTAAKKEKKEDNEMSFVGLQFDKNKKKIIAFADTKSTRFPNRKPAADTNPVHKIYASGEIIMVSYGQNEYVNQFGSPQPLDSLITTNMHDLKSVFLTLRDSYAWFGDAKTEFIMGKKGIDEVFYITVTGDSITEKRSRLAGDVVTVYGGNDEYTHIFDQNSKLNQLDGLGLKRELESLVEFFDRHVDYNYVGGEIEILEWDWQ